MLNKFYFILFFISILSCQAQEKGVLIQQNQHQKPKFKDELFYIEGQLCQHLRIIFQDSKDRLWFGTNVYDILMYNGDSLEYISDQKDISFGRITGIQEDDNGHIWFSAYEGLIRYDGKNFTLHTEGKEGGFYNEVWSFMKDDNGLYWLGTTNGLRQYDGQTFQSFDLPQNAVKDTSSLVSYQRVSCVFQDQNGLFWFGTDGFGIYQYNGKSFQHITKEDGLPDNGIGSITEDSKGNIWITTTFGGISRYDGKTFHNYTEDKIIEGKEVGAFFEDRNGDIWFAAENHGVYCYNGKTFKNYNETHGLKTNSVLAIYRDRQDRFWFGGWGGLFRFDGESFVSVTKDGPWK